jgi:hypothetical protein
MDKDDKPTDLTQSGPRQSGQPAAATGVEGYRSLSDQERIRHREKIGVRAEGILAQFWRDSDSTQAERTLEHETWMDVLETCSHSEIRAAWAEYQKTGPRTQAGKLYKPDPGALYKIIMKRRPKPPPKPAPEIEDKRGPRVSKERIREVFEELGCRVDENGRVIKL